MKDEVKKIVVVGGGFAGINLTKRLANDSRFRVTLVDRNNYHSFTPLLYQVSMAFIEPSNISYPFRRLFQEKDIEAAPVLLGPMSKKAQKEATRVLAKLGVQIKLNVAVKDYADGKVVLANGETIPTSVLIWTSGVIGKEIPGLPPDVVGRARRIIVDDYNRVKGTENIFAIGDIALQTTDEKYPNGHPMLAQVAIQQGKNLAANFKNAADGKAWKPFAYHDKGSMAIIAKYKAVVDLPNGFVKGFIAWVMWLFVHLIPITSFRNKMKLAFSWMWSFMTNERTLRLIIRPQSSNEKTMT